MAKIPRDYCRGDEARPHAREATLWLPDKLGIEVTPGNKELRSVTKATTRPADAVCAQVVTPFEQTVSLDVAGLKAGTYTVIANCVSDTFELVVDNVAP